MTHNEEFWGEDIFLDSSFNPVVNSNGELVLSHGMQTGIQDILLRLITYFGTLFYDDTYGSFLQDFTKEENSLIQQAKLESEVIRRIEEDPRVLVYSAKAHIANWNEKELILQVYWNFIGEDSSSNLILTFNKKLSQWLLSHTKIPNLEVA